jgi:hypothetical protein
MHEKYLRDRHDGCTNNDVCVRGISDWCRGSNECRQWSSECRPRMKKWCTWSKDSATRLNESASGSYECGPAIDRCCCDSNDGCSRSNEPCRRSSSRAIRSSDSAGRSSESVSRQTHSACRETSSAYRSTESGCGSNEGCRRSSSRAIRSSDGVSRSSESVARRTYSAFRSSKSAFGSYEGGNPRADSPVAVARGKHLIRWRAGALRGPRTCVGDRPNRRPCRGTCNHRTRAAVRRTPRRLFRGRTCHAECSIRHIPGVDMVPSIRRPLPRDRRPAGCRRRSAGRTPGTHCRRHRRRSGRCPVDIRRCRHSTPRMWRGHTQRPPHPRPLCPSRRPRAACGHRRPRCRGRRQRAGRGGLLRPRSPTRYHADIAFLE